MDWHPSREGEMRASHMAGWRSRLLRLRLGGVLVGELLVAGIAGGALYVSILAGGPLSAAGQRYAIAAAVLTGLLGFLGARAGGYRLRRRREAQVDREPAAGTGHSVISNLPPRNPNFTGRAELLKELHDRLASQAAAAVVQTQAVHGLGGVGKTQLAIEYAHRFADAYDLVWWMPAEQPASLTAALASLARRLGVPQSADVAEMVLKLWEALRQRDRWLLIYDNAENAGDIEPYRPPAGSGHVLITSRSQAWGGIATTLRIDVLDRTESVAFLRKRLGARPSAVIESLAEQLGDLPLALEQAAAYMEETQTEPDDYLELFRGRAAELLQRGSPTSYEERVATTWEISLRRIQATVPAAEGLLCLFAFLASDEIPYDLATGHPEAVPEALGTAARDPLTYRDAVGALAQYSLVSVRPGTARMPGSISLHRLVQAVVRHRLVPAQQACWAGAAVRVVGASLPTVSDDSHTWPLWQRLVPHALVAGEHALELHAEQEEAANVLDSVAGYLRERGELEQARAAFEQALEIDQAAYGPEHHTVAIDRNNLGTVIQALGDLDGARWQLEQGLVIAIETCGPEHRIVATIRNTLGRVLQNLGNWEGARAQLEQALAIAEAVYDPEHPTVGAVRNTLGGVLQDLGDLDESRRQLERALAIFEAAHGREHPTVAAVLGNLGRVLQDAADWDGAHALLQRALAIDERFYAHDHLSLAVDHNNLGCLFLDMGYLDDAHSELLQAIEIDEAAYGRHHPALGVRRNNLGAVLHRLGDLPAAVAEYEKAFDVVKATYGPWHPSLAVICTNLAAVLADQGDHGAAHSWYERGLEINSHAFGPEHPRTERSREQLAALNGHAGS
jgi:tetratricopeptide (TPR) repeat protein